MQQQQKEAELLQKEEANIRDNSTKLQIAMLTKDGDIDDGINVEYSQEAKDKLLEQIREFDEKLKLDRDKLNLEKRKAETDASIKRQALRKRSSTTNK